MIGFWSSSRLPRAAGEGRILHLILLAWIGGIPGQVHALTGYYSNATLKSKNGDLSVVVYLPKGVKPGERTYYESSRFDWSSMIGSITRTTTNPNTGVKETHNLYGTNEWRQPHDPWWPESGVGLASEFGVGTDGSLCNFLCGWNQNNEVTNGVLGYQEAKSGESFLKIGVGELIKGSCSSCDSAEDYKFNSPYQFARQPVWTFETVDNNSNAIILSHEAVLGNGRFGYKLEKHITLNDDQLLVKTVLSNLGSQAFSTAWYSHHFFTCDSQPVHDGYAVDFDVVDKYKEPATWYWSTPLEDYASVRMHNNSKGGGEDSKFVRIEMQRGLEYNVRIKAEFEKDEQSKGEFTLKACNTKIRETIPEVRDGSSGISMYAYNLYIESGTFSPEPQILLRLDPGQSTSWTQQLDFEDDYPIEPRLPKNPALGSLVLQEETASNPHNSRIASILAVAIAIATASAIYKVSLASITRTIGRKHKYHLVPDVTIDGYPNCRDDTLTKSNFGYQ